MIACLRLWWLRWCLDDLERWTRDVERDYRRNGLGLQHLRECRHEAEALRCKIALIEAQQRQRRAQRRAAA